ncbi:DUF1295 domain-containing protein [Pelagibacterium halotolerans]|uniref:DUF1295 domain-containing protein n=1 Tax=Pelagibacterium halotolerans TaxID=531813 RepID=UPI00384E2D52
MDLYQRKASALPQKIAANLVEIALLALSAWLLFGPGETYAAALFGFSPSAAVPARHIVIFCFSVITFLRFLFMMVFLMKRDMAWEEALSISIAFFVYYVGFALIALPNTAPLGWPASLGIALFALGAFLNTASEIQRDAFKKKPENKGKLYTGGLFGLSMHINFFGDILWVTGYALVAGNPWGGLIPVGLTLFFAFYNVPQLDRHLAARYGAAFEKYARRTKRLVPFVW